MQVINLQSVPQTYPVPQGGNPNGMIVDFIRVNFYILNAGIFWHFQRQDDGVWQPDVALPTGYFSLDRDASGIEFRSQTSTLATVTIELVERLDIPREFQFA